MLRFLNVEPSRSSYDDNPLSTRTQSEIPPSFVNGWTQTWSSSQDKKIEGAINPTPNSRISYFTVAVASSRTTLGCGMEAIEPVGKRWGAHLRGRGFPSFCWKALILRKRRSGGWKEVSCRVLWGLGDDQTFRGQSEGGFLGTLNLSRRVVPRQDLAFGWHLIPRAFAYTARLHLLSMVAASIEPFLTGDTGRNTRGLLRLIILCTIAGAAVASRLFSVIRTFYPVVHLTLPGTKLSDRVRKHHPRVSVYLPFWICPNLEAFQSNESVGNPDAHHSWSVVQLSSDEIPSTERILQLLGLVRRS